MTPDWTKLAPHRPLDPGSAAYEPPPLRLAEEISNWVRAGGSTVLVGGPAGVGKSTELAQVAYFLQNDRVACLAAVDRWENMRRITPDQLLLRIAGRLVSLAVSNLKLPVSDGLRGALLKAGVLPADFGGDEFPSQHTASALDLARLAIGEVTRRSRQGRVALIVDGLEKVIEPTLARELFDALGALHGEADIVTTVPWHVAFGPAAAEPLIRAGERFVAVRAPDVEGPQREAGLHFLRGVVARRLGVPTYVFELERPMDERIADALVGDGIPSRMPRLVSLAAGLSGGLPRLFLQILADAGTYARLRRNGQWPEDGDSVDAIHDQEDSLRRILLPGDKAIIERFDGTDGVEMDLSTKVRLLANGLLLERQVGRRVMLRRHPLLAAIVKESSNA